ncbi:heme-binding protein [Gelidibacter sediminis]|uniref:Heme-binding protein n=1 Tax=Gelidibacter sediminis TaxID=1608710 RepID=A0A4R7PXN7_9FLAO|nr:heme-binding domain-containing protein [Gelidibacter sediminis]TDU39727.1 heme-binding protein [Gelidibacter sediminis]
MKILKIILVGLLIVFVLAQYIDPEENSGSITSFETFLKDTNPNEEVTAILKTSCFDCHSDVTNYPWYNNITPLNFWLAEHIEDGKKHFNISAWDGYSVKKKDHKFEELIEMVESKEMPLESYTYTHAEAKLTDAQIAAVVEWGKKVRLKYSLAPQPQ